MSIQLLIKNGICVNSTGAFAADIAIQEGKIAVIGRKLDISAEKTIDARCRYVFPGLIDAHVHLPWPSAKSNSVDDYASGTAAAVCGGVTTTIEYVVPDANGKILPALDRQYNDAVKSAYSDYAFHLIINRVTDDTFQDMAVVSYKIYTAYEGYRLGDDDILKVLHAARELNALVCFHAEDGLIINDAVKRLVEKNCTDVSYYPQAHPKDADVEITYRIIQFAKYVGTRIHIVHVNTYEAARMIGAARREGLAVSGETCPQYLVFTDEVFRSHKPEASYFVCAPLMRGEADRQGLWQALCCDDLQMIASDHCPYSSSQKLEGEGDFRKIPGGLAGVETSLPLVYTYGVTQDRFPIERLVALMSTNPARIFNLYPRKGIIAVGSDADLVIYDPEATSRIEAARLHSKTDHTVYQGIEVAGKLAMTILGGEVVMQDGEIRISKPSGKLIQRAPYPALPG